MINHLSEAQCQNLYQYAEIKRLDAEALAYSKRLNADVLAYNKRLNADVLAYKEQLLSQIKAEREVLRDLRSIWIARDNADVLWVGYGNPESKSPKRQLLNVSHFHAKGFVPMGGGDPILCFTWDDGKAFSLLISKDSSPLKAFRRMLTAHGVCLMVSERKKKEAAEALLVFLGREADIKEIAVAHGWNKKGSGEWHFAGEHEITIEEVSMS